MKPGAITAASLAIALSACHPAPSTPSTRPPNGIVQVGGETVTASDLALELNGATAPAARETALHRLTERKRMVAEARITGLADDPAVRRAVDGVLIRFLQERRLQPRIDAISIDDTQLSSLFETSAAAQPAPTELTVAILFRASHPADLARRKSHREQLEAIASATADVPVPSGFGARALEASDHLESRYQGGLIPPLLIGSTYNDWRDSILAACNTLGRGELSAPAETPEGIYLARVIERRPGRAPAFNELKGRLRREATRAEEDRIRSRFAAELEAKFPTQPVDGQ